MRCETAELARLRDVSNTLLLGPSVSEPVDDASRLLLRGDAAPTHLLVVTFVRSPENWVADWQRAVGDLPDELVIVTTTDGFGGGNVGDREGNLPPGVRTEYVSSPGDLTGLGMVIGKYLERWYQGDGDIRVSFDSLTTILQYGEPQNVFRFLHLMTTRLDGAGAAAHFLFDPDTQDPQTVATIKSSFQAIAELVGEDEWKVSQR